MTKDNAIKTRSQLIKQLINDLELSEKYRKQIKKEIKTLTDFIVNQMHSR